jgi:hypothetical protein
MRRKPKQILGPPYAVRYVSAERGDDKNPGTASEPWRSAERVVEFFKNEYEGGGASVMFESKGRYA